MSAGDLLAAAERVRVIVERAEAGRRVEKHNVATTLLVNLIGGGTA